MFSAYLNWPLYTHLHLHLHIFEVLFLMIISINMKTHLMLGNLEKKNFFRVCVSFALAYVYEDCDSLLNFSADAVLWHVRARLDVFSLTFQCPLIM